MKTSILTRRSQLEQSLGRIDHDVAVVALLDDEHGRHERAGVEHEQVARRVRLDRVDHTDVDTVDVTHRERR